MKDRGDRLLDDRLARRWCCRSGGVDAGGAMIPAGWYSITRHTGDRDRKPARLGFYSSADCPNAQMPRQISAEAGAGAAWETSARDGQQAGEMSQNVASRRASGVPNRTISARFRFSPGLFSGVSGAGMARNGTVLHTWCTLADVATSPQRRLVWRNRRTTDVAR